ncbi:MAG TPA: phosphate ABC transporter permease PstA [Acidimicrobiales bacterium]|nr:phosphate ABC transporter permease PstA [Acidimicrobiales bacterium]
MALTTIGHSGGAAQGAVAQALKGSRVDVRGKAFEVGLLACLLVSLLVLAALISSILTDGLGTFSDRGVDFLDAGLSRRPARAGISQGIVGSVWIAISVAVVAFPLGIGAAVYLEEYARRNWLTSFIQLNIRNLAGVPSVVYGLLGLAIFVDALNGFTSNSGVDTKTLAAAGITLAVLVLPVMIITTQESLRAVPQELRDAAYGVGSTRWEVIRKIVLPYAAPGIFTGSLLSIARAVGEAAPLIVVGSYTFSSGGAGLNLNNVFDPSHLQERFTALPTVISNWSKAPQPEFKVDLAAATILAMLVFVLLINSIAIVLRNRFEKKRSG